LVSGRELGEGETVVGTRTLSGTTPDPRRWSVADADVAVKALKDALARVEIVLPSVDRESAAIENPLIQLGRCRPDVAIDLAACLDELAELRAENSRKEAPECSTPTRTSTQTEQQH
jgi:hypothetical protein